MWRLSHDSTHPHHDTALYTLLNVREKSAERNDDSTSLSYPHYRLLLSHGGRHQQCCAVELCAACVHAAPLVQPRSHGVRIALAHRGKQSRRDRTYSSCCHRAESATGSSLVCARGVNRTRVRRATYKKSSHEGRQLLRKGARSHPRVPLAACGARPARRGPLHLVRRRVRQRARARQQPGLRRRAAHAPRPSWPHARALAGNTARLTARPRQGRRPGTRAGRPREDGARLEALAEGGGAPRRVLRAVRPRERLSAGT